METSFLLNCRESFFSGAVFTRRGSWDCEPPRLLFHIASSYRLPMLFVAQIARLVVVLAVTIAVTANALRPAPVSFAAEIETAAYASTAATSTSSSSKETNDREAGRSDERQCPCPTEIENADCDDGLCSWLPSRRTPLKAYREAPARHVASAREQNGLQREPELSPPRATA